jgi:hypothetical protein
VTCDDKVAQAIEKVYSKNRQLFQTCAHDSDYQIFPFSGTPPTPSQIRALATSKACTVLFMACVSANLPECETGGISLKAVTETVLKVTMAVSLGRPSPDTMRFHGLNIWRRDSNLAKAAGLPYGNDSALYAEFTRDLSDALTKYSVEVKGDHSIVHLPKTSHGFTFGSREGSGSAMYAAGAVHGNDKVEDGGAQQAREPDTSTAANTRSGGTPLRMGSRHAVVVSVLTLVAAFRI